MIMLRVLLRIPFLITAVIAGISFAIWNMVGLGRGEHGWGEVAFQMWYWLGRPFWWWGSKIHELAPTLPNWQDNALVIATGLMTYLAGDVMLLMIRRALRCAPARRSRTIGV
jgi:hypothetical protein